MTVPEYAAPVGKSRSGRGGDSVTSAPEILVQEKWTVTFNIGQIVSYIHTGQTEIVQQQMDAAPYLFANRTFVPIRFMIEALGGTVHWNQAEQKATITSGTTTVELWIGSNLAKVNGVSKQIDPNAWIKPQLVKPGRTMLPIRFLAEALGYTVAWDQATHQVTITK